MAVDKNDLAGFTIMLGEDGCEEVIGDWLDSDITTGWIDGFPHSQIVWPAKTAREAIEIAKDYYKYYNGEEILGMPFEELKDWLEDGHAISIGEIISECGLDDSDWE